MRQRKPPPTGYERLIAHFGSNIKLAAALGVSKQVTNHWRNGVPLKYADRLPAMTGLKARHIWPEIYAIFK